MKLKKYLIGITIVLLSVGASVLLQAGESPDYPVQDLEGISHQLSELRKAQPTVLIFWSTWCGHCRAEIPKIKEAFGKYGSSGITFLAINPGVRDSLTKTQLYVKRFSLDYPVYFDPRQASRSAFGLMGSPTIILLAADGHEVSRSDSIDLEAIGRLVH